VGAAGIMGMRHQTNWYQIRQTGVKMLCLFIAMSERKPRLEWIRKVLVDLDAREARAGEAAYESVEVRPVVRLASRLRSEHHETEARAAASGGAAGAATTARAS